MQDLVLIDSNKESVYTTSEIISVNTNKSHKDTLELIRKHVDDLQAVGLVTFETRARLAGQHGGGDVEIAILDDYAAMLLITHMRSIGVVKEFKLELVREFKRMRDFIRTELQTKKLAAEQSLTELNKQLLVQSSELQAMKSREPRDEKTLAVVMGCSTYHVVKHYDILVRNGYLIRRELPPHVRYVYEPTPLIGKLCTGSKGDTLLFADNIKPLIECLNVQESLFDGLEE
jgi:phage regulator Rha-like protein